MEIIPMKTRTGRRKPEAAPETVVDVFHDETYNVEVTVTEVARPWTVQRAAAWARVLGGLLDGGTEGWDDGARRPSDGAGVQPG